MEDIIIVSVDGLIEFGDAINIVFPQVEIQRCIVHLIRYTTRFLSCKDVRPSVKVLKEVYQAATEEMEMENLDQLEQK